MMKSTPKIEKLLAEAQQQAEMEEAPNEVKEAVKSFQKGMNSVMIFMKISSNMFLFFSIMYAFVIYSNMVQGEYVSAGIGGLIMMFCLFQFADTYYKIRVFKTSQVIFHNQIEKDNKGG